MVCKYISCLRSLKSSLIATFPYLYPLHYLYGCLIDYNELGENE